MELSNSRVEFRTKGELYNPRVSQNLILSPFPNISLVKLIKVDKVTEYLSMDSGKEKVDGDPCPRR